MWRRDFPTWGRDFPMWGREGLACYFAQAVIAKINELLAALRR